MSSAAWASSPRSSSRRDDVPETCPSPGTLTGHLGGIRETVARVGQWEPLTRLAWVSVVGVLVLIAFCAEVVKWANAGSDPLDGLVLFYFVPGFVLFAGLIVIEGIRSSSSKISEAEREAEREAQLSRR